MRYQDRTIIRVFLVVAVAWSAMIGCTASTAVAKGPLTAQITIPVEELLRLEALPLIIEWTIVGEEAISLQDAQGTVRGSGTIRVQTPSGKSFVISQIDPNPTMLGDTSIQQRQPGEAWEEAVLVSCAWPDPDVPIFDETGKYEIWVQYDDGAVAAESNHVFVRVQEPSEVAEKKALALVKQLNPPAVLYDVEWAHSRTGEANIDILGQIAETEQAIVYPAYARLALATRHVRRASYAKYAETEIDVTQELEKAEALLEKIDPAVKTLKQGVEELRTEIAFGRQSIE